MVAAAVHPPLPEDSHLELELDEPGATTAHTREAELSVFLHEHFAREIELIAEYEAADWGTAYRDFVQVPVLLAVGARFGMRASYSKNTIFPGIYTNSEGREVTVRTPELAEGMGLTYGSWKNRITLYFRVWEFLGMTEDENAMIGDMEEEMIGVRDRLLEWSNGSEVLASSAQTTKYLHSATLRPMLGRFVVSARS